MSCGLRDVLSFESENKPAVLVASSAFEGAAAHRAALGQPETPRVLVQHPIQDRTDEELRDLARAAVDEILRGLRD